MICETTNPQFRFRIENGQFSIVSEMIYMLNTLTLIMTPRTHQRDHMNILYVCGVMIISTPRSLFLHFSGERICDSIFVLYRVKLRCTLRNTENFSARWLWAVSTLNHFHRNQNSSETEKPLLVRSYECAIILCSYFHRLTFINSGSISLTLLTMR